MKAEADIYGGCTEKVRGEGKKSLAIYRRGLGWGVGFLGDCLCTRVDKEKGQRGERAYKGGRGK